MSSVSKLITEGNQLCRRACDLRRSVEGYVIYHVYTSKHVGETSAAVQGARHEKPRRGQRVVDVLCIYVHSCTSITKACTRHIHIY